MERDGRRVGERESGDRQEEEWMGEGENGDRSGVRGGVWTGMSGRGGGERGQTVGWEGERVGIDRGSGVGGGESGDRQGE